MPLMMWISGELVPIGGAPSLPPDPDPTPPPAVIILNGTPLSTTSIRVAWLAPTWTGGTVARYEVDLGALDYDYNVQTTEVTITGLDPDTEYTVTVRAVSTDGLTGPDSAVTVRTNVDTPPPPPLSGWQEVFEGQDFEALADWYDAAIGLAGVGLDAGDMVPGSLATTHDGQVIEGFEGAAIIIGHNNVTIRRCRVVQNGSGYAVRFANTNTNIRGAVIEDCDILRTAVAPDGETRHGMILYNGTSPASDVPALTIRRCKIEGFTSAGGRLGNNVHMEYCAVRRFQYPPGPHANACRPDGINITVRRCLFTDGRSAIASIYFDSRPTYNVTFEENTLYGVDPPWGPSFWVNGKSGEHLATAQNIVWRNNRYGGLYNNGQFTSDVPWGQNGNQIYGERYFDTGALTPWSQD